MINDCFKTNGNVRLVDPNCANINRDMVNAIPQYQDMYIFAELTAESRGRTVIITTNNGGSASSSSSDSTQNINFIGNNQNNEPNNPHYLNFTTNYYDGSTGDRIQYESFGITNIKITVNSSYVPQVNIQFVDIRGLSFFNQENSPYRILFDFPPPIFTLTVKGYYGKMLSYRLHLVKYTSEFLAENGNFVIDANFVAMTFAPLADILFRYVVNFPLMVSDYTLNSDTINEPKNTYELILKVENLYSGLAEKLKTDTDTKNYDLIDKNIKMIDEQLSIINNYKNDETLKTGGIAYLAIKKWETVTIQDGNSTPKTDNLYTLNLISNISEYNNLLKTTYPTEEIPNDVKERLCVVIIGKELITITYLILYKNILIPKDIASLSISKNDIPNPQIISSDFNAATKTNNSGFPTQYSCLDISNYYIKLYKQKIKLNTDKTSTAKSINTKVNNTILEKLGMQPTIYNIFKLILNDVDVFFRTIKTTSIDAENKHNEESSKTIILGNNNTNNKDHIYAFPLIINQEGTVCGGKKEERIAPIKLSEQIPFPEMDLVKNFIDTFQTQARLSEIYSMRENQNADGSNVWIPISPLDSQLGNTNINSPYSTIEGINDSPEITLKRIFKVFLKRFYIISQGVYSYYFYSSSIELRNSYLNYFSKAEAINLVNSLVTPNYISNLELKTTDFSKNLQSFYTFIGDITDNYNNQNINLYNYDNDIVEYFPIDPNITTNNLVYVAKSNKNFIGINFDIGDVQIKAITENTTDPISKFIEDNGRKWYQLKLEYIGYDFINENLRYFEDNPFDFWGEDIVKIILEFKEDIDFENVGWYTRFLFTTSDKIDKSLETQYNTVKKQKKYDDFINGGNILFDTYALFNTFTVFCSENIVTLWVKILNEFDDELFKSKIIKPGNTDENNLSSIVLLSNFGYALSPFNRIGSILNKNIFDKPAIIQLPVFVSAYVGGLLTAIENNWIDKVNTFFKNIKNNKGDDTFYHEGFLIAADIHDVNKYLSIEDKKQFKVKYNDFMTNNMQKLTDKLNEVYEIANQDKDKKEEIYEEYFNPNNSDKISYYNDIILPLITRENIGNNSQITFKLDENAFEKTYISLGKSAMDKKNVNDIFFNTFFNEIKNAISNKNKDKNEEDTSRAKLLADEDIMNQTYYSFKNINDKWLTTLPENNPNGYPFGNAKPLIDSFVFVDRAMNPIGNTMINAEILLDIFNDPNITLYSALSQILSINGFEFFPLQNFMSYSESGWEESFKIDVSNEVNPSPVFVCMYIGGSSSYPSTSVNGFNDDGITDISNPGVSDFSTSDECNPIPEEDNQKNTNPTFPWRQVNAFRVRFGEQNQSMFTDIKIDSKEYPETNESIQILSRLAGDGKLNAPTPKGQNLYNLYENRAYKATVTGLGNVMIQPTQYFQLENIPMFNGAYIILSVQHDITANKMITSFSGTKILKYPVPRVTNPVVFVGLDELGIDLNFNQVTMGSAAVEYPNDRLISKWMTYYQGISKASADRRKLDNTPNTIEYNNIVNIAKAIYDPLCDHFNFKIPTTTVFRANPLNKAVGGTTGSQHRLGEAMDLDGDGTKVLNSEIFYYIANNLEWDQLLWEGGNATNSGWIHVSYVSDGRRPNRKEFKLYNVKTEKYSPRYLTLTDFEKAKTTFYG